MNHRMKPDPPGGARNADAVPRSRRGATLVELLVTMILIIMASGVIVRTLEFATGFYLKRTGDTEAELLCETVCILLQDDLTKHVTDDPASNDQFNMAAYGKITGPVDGLTLPDACYGAAGERKVKISIDSDVEPPYTVTVEVQNASGDTAASRTFSVMPIR